MKRQRKISRLPEPEMLPKPAKEKSTIWRDEYVRYIFYFSLLGVTDVQIAQFFGVSVKTIEYWKRKKPEFMEAMRMGKLQADGKVVNSLFLAAVGYSHDDEVILPNRVKEYDEEGKIRREYTKALRIKTKKHYPPNVTAALKWLQARQPDVWGKRIRIEGHVDHNHKIDLSKFSEQELEVLKKLNGLNDNVQDTDFEEV